MLEYIIIDHLITKADGIEISPLEKDLFVDAFIELVEEYGLTTSGSVQLLTEEEVLDKIREEE